jgi:hypothetical protein
MVARLTLRFHHTAALIAALVVLVALASSPLPAGAQGGPDFTLALDPFPACAADTTLTGTVTLEGLTTGYGFYVQVRDASGIIDGQAFEGHDGYPDDTYDWAVSLDLTADHPGLELYFLLSDGELDPIREEIVPLDGLCDAPATATGQPGVISLPATGAGAMIGPDRLQMALFAGAILLVLAALTALDRPRRRRR